MSISPSSQQQEKYSMLMQQASTLQAELEVMHQTATSLGDKGMMRLLDGLMESNTMLVTHIKSQAEV